MRLPVGRALDRDFDLKYALLQEEVEIGVAGPLDSGDSLKAYLVREEPREGGQREAGRTTKRRTAGAWPDRGRLRLGDVGGREHRGIFDGRVDGRADDEMTR